MADAATVLVTVALGAALHDFAADGRKP